LHLGGISFCYTYRMATKIYESGIVELVDGTELYVTPLKIKYLREFMDAFRYIESSENDDESMTHILECVRISMKQFCPSIKTIYDVEDNLDIQGLYAILKFAAGIKIEPENEPSEIKEKATDSSVSWENTKLAELEAEVFLLGIWKDYEDLELSMSMPELSATLNAKREAEYSEKKFLAAIQGIDIDKQSGKKDEWEEMKARVFSGGKAKDANDITALQGVNARNAGFGIGMGLGYEDLTKK